MKLSQTLPPRLVAFIKLSLCIPAFFCWSLRKHPTDQITSLVDEGSGKCPLKRSYKCKILHNFPENLPYNKFDADAITKLCLPQGVLFEKQEIKPKFHPFLITKENGSKIYGGALTFYELVDDYLICNAMQTLQTMYEADMSSIGNGSSGHQADAPTQILLKKNLFSYNASRDKLYATKCICLLSQLPFNFAFYKLLHTLYDMVKNMDLLGISLESHIYNLLYEIPQPLPGKLTQFHIGCKPIHIYVPDNNELRLFEYDLFEFFKLLGVNNVVNLFTTALLEHQILLYSKGSFVQPAPVWHSRLTLFSFETRLPSFDVGRREPQHIVLPVHLGQAICADCAFV